MADLDTEQLKNETKDAVNKVKSETKETVNQVRDSIKNADFKKDAEATKGFLMEMLSNPFEAVRKVSTGEENVLPKVIILMIVYIAATVAVTIISFLRYSSLSNIGGKLLDLVSSVLRPILYFLVPSIVVLVMNRQNKKSLTTVFSGLVIAGVPTIINSVISIISSIASYRLGIITTPISAALSSLSIVLSYFAMKDMFEEEEHKDFIKKYAVIKLVAAFVIAILTELKIY